MNHFRSLILKCQFYSNKVSIALILTFVINYVTSNNCDVHYCVAIITFKRRFTVKAVYVAIFINQTYLQSRLYMWQYSLTKHIYSQGYICGNIH